MRRNFGGNFGVAPDRWLEDKTLTFHGETISSGCHDAMLKGATVPV